MLIKVLILNVTKETDGIVAASEVEFYPQRNDTSSKITVLGAEINILSWKEGCKIYFMTEIKKKLSLNYCGYNFSRKSLMEIFLLRQRQVYV